MNTLPTYTVPRRARPEEIPAIIALADRVFRAQGGSSMGSEFPRFLAPENASNIWIASHGDEIVSMLGVCHRTLLLPHASLAVDMIGAVATDAQHRGHGLAGALLDAALADAHARGVSIVMISGGRSLYLRRGARYTGALWHGTVPAQTWQGWHGAGSLWRPHEPADAPRIFELHTAQSPRFVRVLDELAAVIPAGACGLKTFTACRNGVPVAYAVLRASGETIAVSEYNGDCACVRGITACLPAGFKGALKFMLPHGHPLCAALQSEAQIEITSAPFEGTMVWGNFPRCIEALAPYWRAHGLSGLRGDETAEMLTLTDGRTHLALPPPAMCAALWGGPDAPPVPDAWRAALPLPLCTYGLDYI